MKKITAIILALIIVTACFASCSSKNGKVTDNNTDNSDSVMNTDDTGTQSGDDTDGSVSDSINNPGENISVIESKPDAETNDVAVSDITDAVKELLGEEYGADADIDADLLAETYGVKSEWVDDFSAQVAMISFKIDTFIAVKAKEGFADSVETALADYKEYTIENSLQYPMNEPKLKGSVVYRAGDYVFYIMLGWIPDEYLDDENAAYEKAVENNMKVIEKINEIILK